jgi:hypothetical protein
MNLIYPLLLFGKRSIQLRTPKRRGSVIEPFEFYKDN